jgi:parallel beta-helix repeat protein
VNREGAFITGNVISANRHSGIFIAIGRSSRISNNIIGLDAAHRTGLGNGGSGIFIARLGDHADISGNYIAFNHDFGIAVERGTNAVDIHPNSIFANWQMGIDSGLDGPNAPDITITSAVYDAATNTTSIDVTYTDESTFFPTLQFYASDAPHHTGYGDGQYYLGTATPPRPTKDFQFRAKGDWRGKWVSATITHNQFYGFARIESLDQGPDTNSSTSEFSRAVEVR